MQTAVSDSDCRHPQDPEWFASPVQAKRWYALIRACVAQGILRESDYRPAEVIPAHPPSATAGVGRPSPETFTCYFECSACGALYRFFAQTQPTWAGNWQPVSIAT